MANNSTTYVGGTYPVSNVNSVKYPEQYKLEPLPRPMDEREKINEMTQAINSAFSRIESMSKDLYALARVVDKISNCEAIKAMIGMDPRLAKDLNEAIDAIKQI
jgi:hypothetical protein